MARQLRLEYEGTIYHITTRGNERKKIYHSQRDYTKFKEYLKLSKKRFGCIVHAYVLMGNHYHLILETPEGNLSKVIFPQRLLRHLCEHEKEALGTSLAGAVQVDPR